MSILNVAVIGAGTSGLCAAKHCLEQGFKVTVYEQTEAIGGIWWYTDKTGKDEYGLNIHSAMYKSLRTNLPHQVMCFPDFSYPSDTLPYPPYPIVFDFLNSYVDHFKIREHIKLRHNIVRINPLDGGQWEILVKDLPNNHYDTIIYDVVLVCNGHYHTPRIPDVCGSDDFKGKFMHSHDYRKPEAFQNETVLVIGAGPSGTDLVTDISKYAQRVTFSQHKVPNETPEQFAKRESVMPDKVTLQEDVKRFTETGAEFLNGTHQTFSIVIFATGYKYSFPFLSVDTGITVDDNFVQPLYKQIINIEHPTMAFIGIPFHSPNSHMYDLQVRFALKFISGAKKLPSKAEMLKDMRAQTQIHWNKGYRKHQTHFLADEQREYFVQVAETAEIKNLPLVLSQMHFDSRVTMSKSPKDYRKYRYTIVDDKTFTKERYED